DFGEHHPARRRDFPVFAVESGLPFRMAIDETPGPARPEIDFTDRHRITFSQPAPPLLHVLGFGHRLENQLPRGIKQARHLDLLIRRRRDSKALAIYCSASYHDPSSPLRSVSVHTRPIDPAALPRFAGSVPSNRTLLSGDQH